MGERTRYEPGTFSWVDLSTTDPDAAKAFYGGLFGWEAHDMPAGAAGTYTMLRLDGDDVAALSAQSEQERSLGLPPHWNSYVTVEDVDASAARAQALGATVLAGPFDVLRAGRMAVVRDPTGAVLSLWQPGEHIGARRVNDLGCLCWNDLMTDDTRAAAEFYTALFGWAVETFSGGEATYTIWKVGDRSNGGMLELTEQHGGAPPHWLPYFTVESCDAFTQTVEASGGAGLAGPMDVPVGRIAAAQDPQGAAFAVFEGQTDR